MNKINLSEILWGRHANIKYLLLAGACLLFSFLDVHDIWTQEHRWAEIVSAMLYRNDYFHPTLSGNNYYDKPLLSYWFIVIFAKIFDQLNTWALRLPSALAGILALWSIYRIGTIVKNKELGFLSGWLLLTTFYFIFWARTSSADMLNLAGSLFAVCWYFEHRMQTRFLDYAGFFLILALTSLCKGLIGAIVPLLVVFVDMCLQGTIKKHVNWRLFLAVLPAAIVYMLPFIASSLIGGEGYQQNGLYLVYRENILRYFQPFDHKDPIYTYFIYLPIYLLPWTLFFIPALGSLKNRWATLSINSKWIFWSILVLFLFFTLSGSRRSYYVLPIVPFAILFTADWLLSAQKTIARLHTSLPFIIVSAFFIFFFNFSLATPLYYSQGQLQRFVSVFKEEAGGMRPWSSWNIVMLDAESKLHFYLHLPPDNNIRRVMGKRSNQTAETLLQSWPQLQNLDKHTIFVSRKRYADFLQKRLPNYQRVEVAPNPIEKFLKKEGDAPIAFIPPTRS